MTLFDKKSGFFPAQIRCDGSYRAEKSDANFCKKLAAAIAIIFTFGIAVNAQAQTADDETAPISSDLRDNADGESVKGNFFTTRDKTIGVGGVDEVVASGYSITDLGNNYFEQKHDLNVFQSADGKILRGISVDDSVRQSEIYAAEAFGLQSNPNFAPAWESRQQHLTASVTNNGKIFVSANRADGFYSRSANSTFSNNGAIYTTGIESYAVRSVNGYDEKVQQKGRTDVTNGPYTYNATTGESAGVLFSYSETKGAAIAFSRAGGSVDNSGLIVGKGRSYGVQAEAENLDNAVNGDKGTVSITNQANGMIFSENNAAIMLGYAGDGDMIGYPTKAKSHVNLIDNKGDITGSEYAILMGDSGSLTDLTINNTGSINGSIKLPSDADFLTTFTNNGIVRGDVTLSNNYVVNMLSGDIYGSLKMASEGGKINLSAARLYGDIEKNSANSGGDLNWSSTQKFSDININTARTLITGSERFSEDQIDGYGIYLTEQGSPKSDSDGLVADLKSATTQDIDKTTRAKILMYSTKSSLNGNINSYVGGDILNTKNITIDKGDALIGGNFTLNSDGILKLGVGSSSNGRLIALGDVIVEKGAKIHLSYDSGYLAPDNSEFTLINGGSLTLLDASNSKTFDLDTDPSAVPVTVSSRDQFSSFRAVKDGNLLKATNSTVSSATALDRYLNEAGISNVSDIEKLSGGGLSDQNNAQLFAPFIDALGTLRTTDYAMFKSINDEMIQKTGKNFATLLSEFAPNQSMMTGLGAGLQSSNQSITSVISQQLTAQTAAGGNSFAVFEGGTSQKDSNKAIANSDRVRNGLAAGDDFDEGISLWLQPVASRVDQDAKDGITGFIANSYGAILGADTAVFEDTRFGVALSYNKIDVDSKGNGDSLFASGNNHNRNDMRADAYGIALFSSYHPGDYFLETQASFTHSDVVSERYVSSSDSTAKGEFATQQYGLEAKIGRNFEYNGTIIAPSVSAQYTLLDQESYTETGLSSLSLNIQNDSPQYLNTGAGVRIAHDFDLEDGSILSPELRTQYLYTLGDTQTQTTSSFVGGGPVFTSKSAAIDHHGVRFGGGLAYSKNNYHIYSDGNYTWRETSQGVEGSLKLKLDF
jgi:uncharacterized protein with beta-barrel porin domain